MFLNDSCRFNGVAFVRYFQKQQVNTVRWIADSIYLVCCIPTAFLNFLVLYTIWRKSPLQTPSNIYLFSLAMSDLCMGAIGSPLLAASDILQWYNYCDGLFAVIFLTHTLGIFSFLIIGFSTLDRFVVLHFHLRYISLITTTRVAGWLVCRCLVIEYVCILALQ